MDVLARKALWDVGLDYLHGTSHGVGKVFKGDANYRFFFKTCLFVGHYLCVHEGPMGISWRVYPDDPVTKN